MYLATRPTILGIDDTAQDLRELGGMLVKLYNVKISTDARQGFERAQLIQPDLILLDVAMPGMDGFAVCRLLKENPLTRPIPVIFLTAHGGPATRVQGFRLGAVDFVNKPYCPEEVLARIQVHLRPRQLGLATTNELNSDVAFLPLADTQVRAALHYIDANLQDPLSVEDVARAVGITEKRLRGMFKEKLGLTVAGFIAEQRMNLGRRLLRETAMPVQDIALEVGFRNPGNFATSFRERTGLTPNAYRQAVQSTPH
jgi:DNA-binding response OmpR family regulator